MISWNPFFIALTIVLATGNYEGEAEQLLFGGWETMELLSDIKDLKVFAKTNVI